MSHFYWVWCVGLGTGQIGSGIGRFGYQACSATGIEISTQDPAKMSNIHGISSVAEQGEVGDAGLGGFALDPWFPYLIPSSMK